jgi:hypothetical protein
VESKPNLSELHQKLPKLRLRVRPRHVDRGGRELAERLPLFLGLHIFEDTQQKTGDSIPRPAASEPGRDFKGSMDHQGTGKRNAGQIVAVSIPDLHDPCLELSQ